MAISDNWHEYFINLAENASLKSKDPSTKVGCIIIGPERQIISTGLNGIPIGVNDNINEVPERYDRTKEKYSWFQHAESNAICLAARHGTALRNSTLYLNFEPWPCPDCSRQIIMAGIKCIVGPNRKFSGKGDWSKIYSISKVMLEEANVSTIIIDIPEKSGIM